MPRIWKNKTDRVRNNEQQIKIALNEIIEKGRSIREVANEINISKSSLARYVTEAKRLPEVSLFSFKPNTNVRQVFSMAQETALSDYLKTCSKMNYGLTTVETKKFVYQYSAALKLKVPDQWHVNKEAGREWLFGFLRRNPTLSIRAPEATSLGRSTSFNKHNVENFFKNVEAVYQRHNYNANQIWNCDETSVTTVHVPPKVIAEKGVKQVGQITSAERGVLVTMLCFISAAGNTLPPVFVFPRKNFRDYMLNNAPSDSMGLAYSSGWMTAENFLLAMEHFIKHSKCSKEDPVVLYLDNHESHISIDVINKVKDNGVTMVTFPPHTSHRLQPLDISVYGPFKAHYNKQCHNWMVQNPAKSITIYNIAGLARPAFECAMSKSNIIKGFSSTGIWPFNPNIFTDDDFLMSAVTDRPVSEETAMSPSNMTMNPDEPGNRPHSNFQHEVC